MKYVREKEGTAKPCDPPDRAHTQCAVARWQVLMQVGLMFCDSVSILVLARASTHLKPPAVLTPGIIERVFVTR